MREDLEKFFNGNGEGNEVKLHGKICVKMNSIGSFTVGTTCIKGMVKIIRPNMVIDGSDAEIEAEVDDCTTSDWALFFLTPSARCVQFKNMNVRVHIRNLHACTRKFAIFYNTAFGIKFENCRLELLSEKQLNLMGIYNNGNLDTHMETRADNLVINDCFIKTECWAEEFSKECRVNGLYNNLANSISVQNTFLYATNRGEGEKQSAIGVYTNGRFGRFVGNNIKANGRHNKGMEKEQAHAYGFINEGLYSLISSNNIVGEWGGRCVGLETSGEYTIVSGNKILSTHTISGRSVVSRGNRSEITGNVLTSTSRNARLLDLNAENCIISQNIMAVLMAPEECQSGCGIYAAGEYTRGNSITENMIRNVRDAGLFISREAGTVHNNMVYSYPQTVRQAYSDDAILRDRLDERHIRSIRE